MREKARETTRFALSFSITASALIDFKISAPLTDYYFYDTWERNMFNLVIYLTKTWALGLGFAIAPAGWTIGWFGLLVGYHLPHNIQNQLHTILLKSRHIS